MTESRRVEIVRKPSTLSAGRLARRRLQPLALLGKVPAEFRRPFARGDVILACTAAFFFFAGLSSDEEAFGKTPHVESEIAQYLSQRWDGKSPFPESLRSDVSSRLEASAAALDVHVSDFHGPEDQQALDRLSRAYRTVCTSDPAGRERYVHALLSPFPDRSDWRGGLALVGLITLQQSQKDMVASLMSDKGSPMRESAFLKSSGPFFERLIEKSIADKDRQPYDEATTFEMVLAFHSSVPSRAIDAAVRRRAQEGDAFALELARERRLEPAPGSAR